MNKKGFSMIEVAFAIVVVVIISICTITAVSASGKVSNSNLELSKMKIYAENAVEIFKYSTDFDNEIQNKLEFVKSSESTPESQKYIYQGGYSFLTVTTSGDLISVVIKKYGSSKVYLEVSYEK